MDKKEIRSGEEKLTRGKLLVQLAKLNPAEEATVDEVSSLEYIEESSVDDSDKDPTFDPNGEYTSWKKLGDSSSTVSEESAVIPLQLPLSYISYNSQSNEEKVQSWLNLSNNPESNTINKNSHIKTTLTPEQTTTGAGDNLPVTQKHQDGSQDIICQTHRKRELENIATIIKRTWKKKKTVCKFCKLEVTNFERHLERQHKDRKEVQEMLSFEKQSKERKGIIAALRKDGHFTEYLLGNVRPMYNSKTSSTVQYYPCSHCKGLYSKKYLARHSRQCGGQHINTSKRTKHLSNSQTLIACSLERDSTLQKLQIKEEVFSIMKPDNISLVAKTDVLICHFGENYLKKHKRSQMATVCSNKMRELARLLIDLRKIKNNEKYELLDILNPVMFDTVIECAKRIGGYDPNTKTYRAPNLSAHIGTSLKQASELLMCMVLKQDSSIKYDDQEQKLKEVKRFRELVTSQWTTEISSLAFKDLHEKKWNKPVILPLTKDILKFRDYVIQIADKAVAALRQDENNNKEYKNLAEATLTLTILYNRKRIGDVQYTKLQTYLENFSSINQEECVNSLSASEKFLTKYYKRLVTGGKGSRAVVILFPKNIQEYINMIIELRNSTNIFTVDNPYLFGYPNTNRWTRGDVVIRKFAKKANLEYPNEITSNKLRKQIATVMQILNLNKEESEQFAQFMGHTEKTHNEFYKLPQDVYETAKVSKLLILMDKGLGEKYKGKSLNEIDINPQLEYAETDESESGDQELPANFPTMPMVRSILPEEPTAECSSELPSLHNRSAAVKKSGRTPWTDEQIAVVKNFFQSHIRMKKAPKKTECEELLSKYPKLLHNKDWVRVKTYVYNEYRMK